VVVLLLHLLLLPPPQAVADPRPVSPGFFGDSCASWGRLLLHNALAKHDSLLPNSGPCCTPVESDRTLSAACTTDRDAQMPCASCLDKCAGGAKGSSEVYILGVAIAMGTKVIFILPCIFHIS
jgi:hypothetical protein